MRRHPFEDGGAGAGRLPLLKIPAEDFDRGGWKGLGLEEAWRRRPRMSRFAEENAGQATHRRGSRGCRASRRGTSRQGCGRSLSSAVCFQGEIKGGEGTHEPQVPQKLRLSVVPASVFLSA